MASKSIIDRVLLLAAAVCAAGLIWQLTVLLTSKGRMPAAHGVDMASSAAAATGSPAPPVQPPAKPDAVEPAQAPVRVVYPDADTPKTTAKITESVPAAPAPAPVPPSAPANASAAATPDTSSNSPPTTGVIPVAMVAPISKPSAPAETAPAEVPVADSPAAATPASAPAPDEVASAEPAAQPDTPAGHAPAVAPAPVAGATININSASIEALNHLRGGGHIGQAIARHRPYRSVDDLMRKRVLRRDVFERIRGQIAAK